MAEQHLSAPPCAPHGIPTSGVGHINHPHRERYVKIGNHLAQHRELSLTAIGLSTHIQSLPSGAKVSIKALSARFQEGEVRIAAALRELEAHGYLSRTQERLPSGRVITRTVSYNNPPAMQLDGPERPERAPAPTPKPEPDQDEDPEPGPDPAQTAAAAPRSSKARPMPAPTTTLTPEEHREAADLLARLRLRDPRLLLSERDVARLAPAVATWLERGLSPAAVSGTLAGCLPAEPIHSPAAFLAHRLAELRPPLVADRPAGPRRHPDRQIHPFQTCDTCDRAFRAASPGHCGACSAVAA